MSSTDCKFAGFTPSVVRINSYPSRSGKGCTSNWRRSQLAPESCRIVALKFQKGRRGVIAFLIDLDAVNDWIESAPKKPWDGLRWRKLTRHRNRFFYMAPSLIQRAPLRLLFDGFRAWSYQLKNNFQAQKVTGVSPPLPLAHFLIRPQGDVCIMGRSNYPRFQIQEKALSTTEIVSSGNFATRIHAFNRPVNLV